MSELSEPIELEFYPFLDERCRATVDQFLEKLDPRFRTFAFKRYGEGKTIQQIAEEMGYSERNLFKFRKRILLCWYFQSRNVS
ncbi:MAG: hypothetical protein P4L69_20220 [Desulfosporosinus sp.]|nr:hypothetical protein [Desulfosporosinus sp.]